jgi:hypothetical protein
MGPAVRPSAHSWLGRNFGSSSARLHLRLLQLGIMARQVWPPCGVFIVYDYAFGPLWALASCIGLPDQPFGSASGCVEFHSVFSRVSPNPRTSSQVRCTPPQGAAPKLVHLGTILTSKRIIPPPPAACIGLWGCIPYKSCGGRLGHDFWISGCIAASTVGSGMARLSPPIDNCVLQAIYMGHDHTSGRSWATRGPATCPREVATAHAKTLVISSWSPASQLHRGHM